MKILVIGGTGHIGSHLIPMLVSQGHSVYIATRGNKKVDNDAFVNANFINCNASDSESMKEIAEQYNFDTVIDFPGTAYTTWNVFKDKVEHIIVCGSLWMFGRPKQIPTPEIFQSKCPFQYYVTRYEQIGEMLKQSQTSKTSFTAIMPPNICGPGKIPLDTMGGRSVEVHSANMRGEVVYLPEGPEALIAPCDAYDLAALFSLAVNNRKASAGQIFNGGPAYALSSTQFVNVYAEIYGKNIPIEYVSWEKYKEEINPNMGAWWHFYSDMCPDISKAKKLLGYEPRYTPEEAIARAVNWMKINNLI